MIFTNAIIIITISSRSSSCSSSSSSSSSSTGPLRLARAAPELRHRSERPSEPVLDAPVPENGLLSNITNSLLNS